MKIRMHATGNVRDCAQDIGSALVEAGLATALTPKQENDYNIHRDGTPGLPYHDVNWFARDGEIVELGRQYAPALVWRCQTCQQVTYNHPEKEPASDNVFHFQKQICPAEVYAAYLRLFEAWSKKGARKLKGKYQSSVEAYAKRTNDSIDRDEIARIKAGEVVAL